MLTNKSQECVVTLTDMPQSLPMVPAEWQSVVGDRIRARRDERGLSIRGAATLAGFSEGMWRQLESGVRPDGATVRPKAWTKIGACYALGWTADSIDRMIAGGDPALAVAIPDAFAAEFARLRDHVARQDQRILRLARQVATLMQYANARAAELSQNGERDEM